MDTSDEQQKITNIHQTTWRYIRKNCRIQILILVVLFIVGIPLFPLAGIIVAIAVASYFYVRRKMWAEFVQELGQSIGFSYAATATPDTVTSKLLSIGRDVVITDVLSGSYKDIPVRMYTYLYIVGAGKQSTSYTFLIFEVTFQGTMPEIFIASKFHFLNGFPPETMSMGKLLKVEGDFNTYFYPLVLENKEIEALELLTPDVMAGLIDRVSKISLEFSGNKMYIYSRMSSINSTTDMQAKLELVEYLSVLCKRNASEIKDNE